MWFLKLVSMQAYKFAYICTVYCNETSLCSSNIIVWILHLIPKAITCIKYNKVQTHLHSNRKLFQNLMLTQLINWLIASIIQQRIKEIWPLIFVMQCCSGLRCIFLSTFLISLCKDHASKLCVLVSHKNETTQVLPSWSVLTDCRDTPCNYIIIGYATHSNNYLHRLPIFVPYVSGAQYFETKAEYSPDTE